MFCFDIETLSKESTAVVLSASIVHFEPSKRPSYQELLDNTLFVKFNAKDQITRLKRSVCKSTLEWWDKQSDYAKAISLIPKSTDVLVEDGLIQINNYMNKFPDARKKPMWARGNLDQVTIDSLSRSVNQPEIAEYYTWRDVRTYIDVVYGASNGYCEVDHPSFDKNKVIKHTPYHDVCYDVMMILYGKEKE